MQTRLQLYKSFTTPLGYLILGHSHTFSCASNTLVRLCVCVYDWVCVRACVHACMHACVTSHACACVYMCVYACACM